MVETSIFGTKSYNPKKRSQLRGLNQRDCIKKLLEKQFQPYLQAYLLEKLALYRKN